MKIEQVLETIGEIVVAYHKEMRTTENLKKWSADLSCNLYYLSQFMEQFEREWVEAKENSPGKSIAAKEHEADLLVPERHMAKVLYNSAERVLINMGSHLKYQ